MTIDWTPPGNSSCATSSCVDWLRCQPSWKRKAIIQSLNQAELKLIDRDWDGWSHQSQKPPQGPWATWLFLGGRGAGKTRAGAEWLYRQATPDARLALIGSTLHDVREVMIEGPSGLKAIVGDRAVPTYHPSRKRLDWPNGAVAHVFSAEDPDSLRGPQFHAAWADEFCAWKAPETVLAMVRLGLRLGSDPRLVVTTTPRPIRALKILMEEPTTEVTRAATKSNAANLAQGFLSGLDRLYGGTRLAAQELDGSVLDAEDGLWTHETLQDCRSDRPPVFETVVVAVDPPATARGDACGIVVVGRIGDVAYVLDDRSVKNPRPRQWAHAVARAVAEYEADWVVAETNQGGDMVEEMLKIAHCGARIKSVHAVQSKRARAEPVAAMYEKGQVRHCAPLPLLEEEMMAFGSNGGSSPDRVDALVWAVTHLLLGRRRTAPRIRAV